MSRNRSVWVFVMVWLVGTIALADGVCDGVSPVVPSGLEARLVVDDLLNRPVLITAPPGDTERIFIVGQKGDIRVASRGPAPLEHTEFLNIRPKVSEINQEMGMLSMTFDPNYAENGYFYVSYTAYNSNTLTVRSVIARYSVSADDPNVADPDSEHIILRFVQFGENHNAGHLVFGSDGYLYISFGDGGGNNDNHGECGFGQLTSTLMAKIVRIDPHATGEDGPDCAEIGNYTIPPGNPFADGPGGECDEIWSYGMRNPWRFNFDPANDDLYVSDVGNFCWEEINYVAAADHIGGENFGWRQMEGAHCFDNRDFTNCDPDGVVCGSSPACNDDSLIDPVYEFGHDQGCAIIGGEVYRGCRMPEMHGNYFFGDYCNGWLRSLEMVDGVATNVQEWSTAGIGFALRSFGMDGRGELYMTQQPPQSRGLVYKLMPPFIDFEVSGPGVGDPDQFLLDRAGSWTWEDLARATMIPVDQYRVYRQQPGGNFTCIHQVATTEWESGGDPSDPAPGELFSYLVTAVSEGDESAPGGTTRVLDPCGL